MDLRQMLATSGFNLAHPQAILDNLLAPVRAQLGLPEATPSYFDVPGRYSYAQPGLEGLPLSGPNWDQGPQASPIMYNASAMPGYDNESLGQGTSGPDYFNETNPLPSLKDFLFPAMGRAMPMYSYPGPSTFLDPSNDIFNRAHWFGQYPEISASVGSSL